MGLWNTLQGRRVCLCCVVEGGVQFRLHDDANMDMMPPIFLLWEGSCVGIKEFNQFVDGFIAEISFNLRESFDRELGNNLTNSYWIGNHNGCLITRIVESN